MKTSVPPVDLKAEFREVEKEFLKRAKAVFTSGRYVLGGEVSEFESQFARFIGTRYAIGIASGSDAILLGLMALDIKAGDEVITTPFTFVSTVTAVARLGAKPVFVDIEPATFNLNPDLIEAKLTKRTRGVIAVHLYGNPCRMDKIQAIAKRRGLFVVEDCAQACGASYQNKKAGSFDAIGAFSFYPTTQLDAFGDAGMINTND